MFAQFNNVYYFKSLQKSATIIFKYHGDNAEREYSAGIHFERSAFFTVHVVLFAKFISVNGGIVTSNVFESPPVIEGPNTTWTVRIIFAILVR